MNSSHTYIEYTIEPLFRYLKSSFMNPLREYLCALIDFYSDPSHTSPSLNSVVDGVAGNDAEAQQTMQRIRQYLQATPTVYLPSHDPDASLAIDEPHSRFVPSFKPSCLEATRRACNQEKNFVTFLSPHSRREIGRYQRRRLYG